MRRFVAEWKEVAEADRESWLTCRRYRLATGPYLRWWKQEEAGLADALTDSKEALMDKWRKLSIELRAICR
jgi:hypothetical protein